jgi:hypothetical protein
MHRGPRPRADLDAGPLIDNELLRDGGALQIELVSTMRRLSQQDQMRVSHESDHCVLRGTPSLRTRNTSRGAPSAVATS